MKILLEQGIHDMRNAGQNALLQIAVERIRKNWPTASIEITTNAPYLFKLYFPGCKPVRPFGQGNFVSRATRLTKIIEILPIFVLRIMLGIREFLWNHFASLPDVLRRKNIKTRSNAHQDEPGLADFSNPIANEGTQIADKSLALISSYDLVVATGSQYLTDIARQAGMGVLQTLNAAIQHHIPTALVGQGIGPIEDIDLYAAAKSVLPQVGKIFVRERLFAPNFLTSLGVDPKNIFITGDDALEIAYREKRQKLGAGIGISLRVTSYTDINRKELSMIGEVLKQYADQYKAKIVSLPISYSPRERDDRHIKELFRGYKNLWLPKKYFPTPVDIVHDTQKCRLVVAGTFHGAVFALGQGIPVICLMKGASYINKLSGLADLFGPGCAVIDLNDEKLEEVFDATFVNLWQMADRYRSALLEAALQQVNWGQSAYHDVLANMLEPRTKNDLRKM
jgi:polysaccharide pyruvyl transferase WcaK-like protein